ncbi:MAG: hypothetical protein J2O48_12895 [Solirubrobacterales bacterium]|nr:hypothetical protein [Solirubrobacterales bacterium]
MPSGERLLSWRELDEPGQRRMWWGQLWHDVCLLRVRYQLPVRCRWWEDQIQVETLAALAAWVWRYDCGEWDDPPGKLSLLFELERIEPLLRDGRDPFQPEADRAAFEAYLERFEAPGRTRVSNPIDKGPLT